MEDKKNTEIVNALTLTEEKKVYRSEGGRKKKRDLFLPKGPLPFNSVGLFTFLRTYARRHDEKDPNSTIESWEECLERVITACNTQLKVGFTDDEIEELFDLLYNLKGSVAGRFLWQLGTGTVDRLGLPSLQNCLGSQVEFWTDQGVKKFSDFKDGERIMVRGKTSWMPATVKCFGEQPLVKLTMGMKNARREILCTANHRWLAKTKKGDGVYNYKIIETSSLVPKMRLAPFTKKTNFHCMQMCPVGIQHGIVFGDGNIRGNVDNCAVTLCGKKKELSKFFFTPRKDNREITGLPNTWKTLPSMDMNKEYIYGFLAGWFATDGCVSESGTSLNIHNKDREILQQARGLFSKIDIVTSDIKLFREISPFDGSDKPCYKIAIYRYNLPREFMIRSDQIERFKEVDTNVDWKVISVEETDRIEPVWCVVEPENEEFTLANGVLTKNCSFTVVDSPIEPFTWAMNFLMLGSGVGYRILPSDIDKFPVVKRASINRKDADDADFIVPDSREGWVKLLSKVMKAHFYSGKGFTYSCRLLRSKGSCIKSFGGVASGPDTLCIGMGKINTLLNKRAGQKIKPIDALDIMNIIGELVLSGNVRRSAQIAMGDCKDKEFLMAKRWDLGNIPNHRSCSNNSVICNDINEILDNKDFWAGYEGNGEPYGLINLKLHQSCGRLGETQYPDPDVEGVNPCCFSGDTLIAVADGRHAVPIKQLTEEGKDVPVYSMDPVSGKVEIKWGRNPRITGRHSKLLRITFKKGGFIDVTPSHKFYTMDGTRKEAYELEVGDSIPQFSKRRYKDKKGPDGVYTYFNVRTMSYVHDRLRKEKGEHIMIAKFNQPEVWEEFKQRFVESGHNKSLKISVHHINHDKGDNRPENLEIITAGDHLREHLPDMVLTDKGRQILSDKMTIQKFDWDSLAADDKMKAALEIGLNPVRVSETKVEILKNCEHCMKEFTTPWAYRGRTHCNLICANKQIEYIEKRRAGNRLTKDAQGKENFLKQGEIYKNLLKSKRVVSKKDWEKACRENKVPFRVQPVTPNPWIAKNWTDFKNRVKYFDEHGELPVEDSSSTPERISKSHKEWHYDNRKKDIHDQVMCYKDLQNTLERDPTNKEWKEECATRSIKRTTFHKEQAIARGEPSNWAEFKKYADDYNHRIESIEELKGLHTVYNITIEDHHTMGIVTQAVMGENNTIKEYKGIFARNSEQSLCDRESCCLSDLYLPNIKSKEELFKVSTYLYRICKHSLTLACTYSEETEAIVHKNMRMGIGVTGYLQATPEQQSWLSDCYEYLRKFDKEYSIKHGFPQSIKLTTVKPSGTLSLLAGVTSGIHPGYSQYYIRRIRIASDSSLIKLALDHGHHIEPVKRFDGTLDHSTSVISFPYCLPPHTVFADNCSAITQLEVVKRIQTEWSDNSVSCTVTYKKEELPQIKEWLKLHYNKSIKSVSFLLHSGHGFIQAPIEPISREVYEEMIRNSRPITSVAGICFTNESEEALAQNECAGGACPLR